MRHDDPLAEMMTVTPRDLAGRPLISYGNHADEIGPQLNKVFQRDRLMRDVSVQVASSVGAVPLACGGIGIALIDGLVRWNSFEGVTVRPFMPEVTMNVAVSTNTARPLSRFFKPFVGELRQLFRALPA
ncbi:MULTISPECIES: LysR substrate-binding domain-containing protein [unclassified Agrobacterium]|uniref:LysR substrate-binding domain-containing protein n=1 Tax=unclassified Agrobacterium TaxID=2632611 RepID=UPI0024484FEC|nr:MULTISPECIES: LysR substrate-binding domain-containing protein [unclassified Agrobacterium]MDH0612522.1 LysR substrate-binding domain-containing protein [Agrobacterium sp. GD03872]MDH0696419.1 LysR substrate-binding domain-containing protein [Agrobacterium sp. GD03871]MDH1059321.1 LysR substrate-binding domain-containing protein [Agrobacterium sp. GD03992]MDH2210682.1 LysR substrate-binding domain-containing protein [Agrobacterium sp. GD03643]MDH2218188.1 LysR substrate-binding domain-conta